MPRPKKCRKVCSMPKICEFYPEGHSADFITLTVDEYESLRLIDKQGFSQTECAAYMQISRTTAQQIYNSARHKIAPRWWTASVFALSGEITVFATAGRQTAPAAVVRSIAEERESKIENRFTAGKHNPS